MTTLNKQLINITRLDVDKASVLHLETGVIVTWPKAPEGIEKQLSTIFQLIYKSKVLQFRTRWNIKQMGAAKTLICQPYIDDDIERTPTQDPLYGLIKFVYACLWRYAEHLKIDPTQQFALVYNNEIYIDDIKQVLSDPQT